MLVQETGTGLSTANSYATVQQADNYWQSHIGGAAWLTTRGCPLSVKDKEILLITASELLDELNWQGYKCNEGQGLQFPRRGLNKAVCSSNCSVPKQIIIATVKLALAICNEQILVNTNSENLPIKKVKAGDIETEYFVHNGVNFNGKCGTANSADKYKIVRPLIKCFLQNKSFAFGNIKICRS